MKQMRQQDYDMNEREAEKENLRIYEAWMKQETQGGEFED